MSTERITIVSVEAENYRRLKVAEIKLLPKTGLVRVTGKNAAGKTSLLKAVAGVLGGAAEVHPGTLHDGAEDGRVTLRLSNGYTVVRHVTESNPKGYLHVVGPDDGKHSQSKLNTWLGERSFDPLAFLTLDAKRQREVLFSIGTDPDLPEKLAEVRADYATTYEERTPVISRKRHLAKIEAPEGERPEPVDTSAEMARLRELQAAERARGDSWREWQDAERLWKHKTQVALDAESDVVEAEEALQKARAALRHAEHQRDAAEVIADERGSVFEALPDPEAEIMEVQSRLESANEIQSAIEPWKRYDEALAEVEDLAVRETNLTAELGSLKRREADLLEKAGIPVDGLSFDDDGAPLLHGRSLDLASGAQRIDLAVDVAIAHNPDLGVCLLDEANDLDLDAMRRLHDRAVEHGFQVWVARIGIETRGEILVDNGVARDVGSWDEADAAEAVGA